MGGRRPGVWWRVLAHAVVYGSAVVMVLPLVWMVVTAMKSDAEIASGSWGLPGRWRVEHFAEAWRAASLGRYYFNSVAVSVSQTVLGVLHCALAGYALAKVRFVGRGVVLWVVLGTMMLPIQVYFLLSYLICDALGYVDTLRGLVVPFLASGFGVYYMRQAVSTVPDALVEAGRLDGMTEFEIFWHVVRPAVGPALAALGIFTFAFSWNSFFWPLIVIDSRETTTLPVAVSQLLSNQYGQSWALVMAALTLITVPMVVVFVVLQRWFVEGATLTGLKEG